ncbi:arylesterase [Paraburkholderia hayleyella]|uniref:arylesterase n=1 Tax=Paraburkholderia hayleyella TaxID=2152889 RepID=UPI0015812DC7|nr:arylesterase [Paraburkholderia hayleyella]
MRVSVRWKAALALGAMLLASGVSAGEARAAGLTAPPRVKPAAIVVLGDSLSAEYGLPRGTGWVALLRERVAATRADYSVANASISGDTTSGGRARLGALLQRLQPAVLIVELGGNDALRGVPLSTTEDNLRTIILQAQQQGAKVVLVGMQVPPNYGPDYSQKFQQLYRTLAQTLRVPLVPFLLAGMETRAELFQADQIHPSQEAQPLLLNNVWPVLQPVLKAARTSAAATVKTH